MSRIYTINEVADRYAVHINTVRNWLKEGKLTFIKVGRQYRVREQDLEEFEKPVEVQ